MELIPSAQHKKCDITKKVFIYYILDLTWPLHVSRYGIFPPGLKNTCCIFYICMIVNLTFLAITGIAEYFSLDPQENTPQLFKIS